MPAQQPQQPHIGGDATGIMMAAAKLATTATGTATTNKVDDVIDDINKKKQSIRSEAEVHSTQFSYAHTLRVCDVCRPQPTAHNERSFQMLQTQQVANAFSATQIIAI